MNRNDAQSLISSEYDRATSRYPKFNSPHEGYAVILEELDELKAVVWKSHNTPVELRAEAKQVAAMALRFMVDLC